MWRNILRSCLIVKKQFSHDIDMTGIYITIAQWEQCYLCMQGGQTKCDQVRLLAGIKVTVIYRYTYIYALTLQRRLGVNGGRATIRHGGNRHPYIKYLGYFTSNRRERRYRVWHRWGLWHRYPVAGISFLRNGEMNSPPSD